MGTVSKVGLKIWSFLDFFGAFWAPRTPQNFLKQNHIVGNIKVDVWEEKCDIPLKDRSISLKALIFFTLWPEHFPVAWTVAYLLHHRCLVACPRYPIRAAGSYLQKLDNSWQDYSCIVGMQLSSSAQVITEGSSQHIIYIIYLIQLIYLIYLTT